MARVHEAENNQFDSTVDGECPICINKMEGLKTLALCRHAFCAPCITNYIKSKGGEMIGCPFCRKSVTYLAIQTPATLKRQDLDYLKAYNMRYSEERTFGDAILDAPTQVA